MPSIFTRIIQGEIPCYKIAEDADNDLEQMDMLLAAWPKSDNGDGKSGGYQELTAAELAAKASGGMHDRLRDALDTMGFRRGEGFDVRSIGYRLRKE